MLIWEWKQNCIPICRSGRIHAIANNFTNPCWLSNCYVLSMGKEKGNNLWIIGNTAQTSPHFLGTKSSRDLVLQRQVTGVLHLFMLANCDHHDPCITLSEQRIKDFFEILQSSNFLCNLFLLYRKPLVITITIGNSAMNAHWKRLINSWWWINQSNFTIDFYNSKDHDGHLLNH